MEPDNTPLFRAAAERLRPEGEDADAFLELNLRLLGTSGFPGPNCLHPDELAAFRRTNELPAGRQFHAAECGACGVMIEASRPSEQRVQAFLAAAAKIGAVDAVRPLPAGFSWRLPAFGVAAAALLAAVVVFAPAKSSNPGSVVQERAPAAAPQVVVQADYLASAKSDTGGVSVRVSSPPVTVTADRDQVAVTAAVSAALVTLPEFAEDHNGISQASASGESETDCRQGVVSYYSELLKRYKEAKSPDAADWLNHTRQSPTTVDGVSFSWNGSDTHVVCRPSSPRRTSKVFSIQSADTLRRASVFLKAAEKSDLDPSAAGVKYIPLDLDPQIKISIAAAEANVDVPTANPGHPLQPFVTPKSSSSAIIVAKP